MFIKMSRKPLLKVNLIKKEAEMSEKSRSNNRTYNCISRRSMRLFTVAQEPRVKLTAGAVSLTLGSCATVNKRRERVVRKGRINQSIVYWCFQKYWDVEKTCQIAKQLGCKSVELVEPKDWPTLRKHGLICAIAGSHGFKKGMNNPEYHNMCLAKLRGDAGPSRLPGRPHRLLHGDR